MGGQALIEGIVMQGPKGAVLAVRKPDKTIFTESKKVHHARDDHKWLGWPMIRGICAFIESMVFGYKCLMESADLSGQSEIDEQEMSRFDKWIDRHLGEKMMAVISVISTVLGFGIAFLLFYYLPTIAVSGLSGVMDPDRLRKLRPLFEGIIKILIFIAYVWLVSLTKDIKRVFMYHGAEHKTIFCYEHGLDLTVENVKKQKRFHPRCGTSFIFVMMIISILIATLIVFIIPSVTDYKTVWILVKLLILPLVMGAGYEFIRYAGRHDNIITKIFSAPGLWMQRLTTKEPTDDIIEVGIAALSAVITDDPEDDTIK